MHSSSVYLAYIFLFSQKINVRYSAMCQTVNQAPRKTPEILTLAENLFEDTKREKKKTYILEYFPKLALNDSPNWFTQMIPLDSCPFCGFFI